MNVVSGYGAYGSAPSIPLRNGPSSNEYGSRSGAEREYNEAFTPAIYVMLVGDGGRTD
jgi:hypothetical protein